MKIQKDLHSEIKAKGFRHADTLSEVAISAEVIILDVMENSIKKQGGFKALKAEWKDENLFYKKLREMIDERLVFIKLS